jgi:hypothetical protein
MNITEREQTLIDTVARREKWVTFNVTARNSGREFDLLIEGTHKQFNDRGCKFSALLPLAALHSSCDWCSPEIASMTDYPSMAMDGDWSAVRDTNEAARWRIFDTFIEPMIGAMGAMNKVIRNKEASK